VIEPVISSHTRGHIQITSRTARWDRLDRRRQSEKKAEQNRKPTHAASRTALFHPHSHCQSIHHFKTPNVEFLVQNLSQAIRDQTHLEK
jgi:hypothetical protein